MTTTEKHRRSNRVGTGKDSPHRGVIKAVPTIWVILLGVILLIATGCGDIEITWDSDESTSDSDEPVETRDNSFTVGPSPRINVISFNGRITVNPSSDNTVRVQAELRRADRIDYQVRQDGDTVSVEARQKGRTSGRSPGAHIDVMAPSSSSVELRTSNGTIELSGINKSGTLRTSNGTIIVENMKGDLDAGTSNGAIEVTGFVGSAILSTSNGAITFNGELVSRGRNEMETSNGSVDVTLQGTPSVRLDATTSNGNVTSKLPILTTSVGENHLAGTIGNGEAELFIHTSNGSVTIRQ